MKGKSKTRNKAELNDPATHYRHFFFKTRYPKGKHCISRDKPHLRQLEFHANCTGRLSICYSVVRYHSPAKVIEDRSTVKVRLATPCVNASVRLLDVVSLSKVIV